MKKIQFTENELQKIKDLYLIKKLSLEKIGKEMGVTRTPITRIVKEQGWERPDIGNRKYIADYDNFEKIDNEEKAYWLGFIAADGCVYVRPENASIILNIHRKDRGHLEKFKKFMNSNVKIVDHIQTEGFSNNTPMSKMSFNSKKMAQDFIDKGVTPRKSLTLKPPKIDEKYWLPFILGYFDGDGSICYLNNSKVYEIGILGTSELLTWINSILNISENNILRRRNPDDNKNNFYIRCGGSNKPYQIMKKLYDSCPVYLDRKYKIFKELEKVVLSRNIK